MLTEVRVQGPVADAAGYDLAGVFAEDRVGLMSDRLELRVGGRFTYARADADRVRDPDSSETLSLEDSWESVVGSGRVLWQAAREGRMVVYAGASQGFRAPNLSDLTRFDADAGQQEIPGFGLEPEQFLSTEAGVRVRWGRVGAEAAYYYTFMEDLVVRVPTGEVTPAGDRVVAKQNSGEGHMQGVELAGQVQLHRDWTLWANATWMDGRLRTPLVEGGAMRTEPVSRLMPMTASSGLRWKHWTARVWAELACTFAEKQDQLSASDRLDTQRIPVGGTPGYGVGHVRVGWNPWPAVALSAALENLTDEDYRVHGSGVNEPGRSLIVNAAIRF